MSLSRAIASTMRTSLRVLFLACWALALFCLLAAGTPDPAGAVEIAILKSADLAAYNQAVTGFKATMPSAATFIEYDMKGEIEQGRKLARRIRASDAALVFAVGLKAALVAKLEIVDVPVIFSMVRDPAKYDLIAANMTGISLQIPTDSQFAAMRSVLTRLKRIGVLYDPEKTGALVEEARRLAKRLGLELVERQVRSEKEVPATLRPVMSQVEALWLVPDSTVLTEESLRFILSTTLEHNVPVVGYSSEFVRNGALLGLSVNSEDVGRQAGLLAKKILIDQYRPFSTTFPPVRLRLTLNLKTARVLGITIPPDVLNRADELY